MGWPLPERTPGKLCGGSVTADNSRGVDPAACSLQGMAADQLTSEPGHGRAKVPSKEFRILYTKHWIRTTVTRDEYHVILVTKSKCCTEHRHLMACLAESSRSYLISVPYERRACWSKVKWRCSLPERVQRVGRGWREYDGMNEKKLDECCSLLAKKAWCKHRSENKCSTTSEVRATTISSIMICGFPSKATKILVVRTVAKMYIKIQVEKWMESQTCTSEIQARSRTTHK